jgi:Flp pilus assembly protein TadD
MTASPANSFGIRRFAPELLIVLSLLAATVAVYQRAWDNGFVNYDDNVTGNPHVEGGLTLANVRWAFTTVRAANWHPLTWLSWQLDYQCYGGWPAGFHITNTLLHAANTILLFLALRQLTGCLWPSAFVAAFFALHPLHVESVAWVAERKDTLSTFFWMLTLLAYAWYARRPGCGRYLLVVLPFALGLMSKPMVVTLPFVLLLLDYWPLGRLRPAVILEKVPLLALSAAACVVTWYAQNQGEAIVRHLDILAPGLRAGNAVRAYAAYIVKMLRPMDLCVFYPHPVLSLSWTEVTGAAVFLATITVAAFRLAHRYPYMIVGWLWYVGTLVPVIGLVQVGGQAMADRYTYVPLIGLFVMAAWGIAELTQRWELQWYAALVGVVLVLFCAVVSWSQIGYWQDDKTLWFHAVEVAGHNGTASNNLGIAFAREKNFTDAIACFREAILVAPQDVQGHANLAGALMESGQLNEAAVQYRKVFQLDPGYLGNLLPRADKAEDAVVRLRAAVQAEPSNLLAAHQLGRALGQLDRWQEAVPYLRQAAEGQPDKVVFHSWLADALDHVGESEAARAQYSEANRLDPAWVENANRLARLFATHPDPNARNGLVAVELARQACGATDKQDPRYLDTLAAAYAELGRYDDATRTARKALALATTPRRSELATEIEKHLRLFETGQPVREAPSQNQ